MPTIIAAPAVAVVARPNPWSARSRRHPIAVLVLALGLVATAVGAWRAGHLAGTYRSQVRVYFLAPLSARNPNTLVISSDSLVTTAGVVAQRVATSNGDPTAGAVTLTGEGVRHGDSVSLPDSGGQWATNFDTPALDVQVTGPTAADVRSRTSRLLGVISAQLAALQDPARVDPVNRIVLNQVPSVPSMFYERGSRIRALGAALLLGSVLSLAAAFGADRWATRPRRPRRPRCRPS